MPSGEWTGWRGGTGRQRDPGRSASCRLPAQPAQVWHERTDLGRFRLSPRLGRFAIMCATLGPPEISTKEARPWTHP